MAEQLVDTLQVKDTVQVKDSVRGTIGTIPLPKTPRPPSLPKSKVKWLLIRDKIKVNAAVRKEMQDEIDFQKLAPGTAVGLVAREITHDKNFTLQLNGFPLFVIADIYDGNGGAINTSGYPGAPGASGTQGAKGFAAQTNSKDGGPGTAGKAGQPGTPASPITLIATTVRNAKLIARGGAGGPGGAGGTGGPGDDGKTSQQGKFDPIDGTDGGPGGNGGNGGNGAPGAPIAIHYVTLEGVPSMDAAGGPGGLKGAAGAGGKGGTGGGQKGAAGKPGAAGAAGKTATTVKTSHDQKAWDTEALNALGSTVEQWTEHRVRVADYNFRLAKATDVHSSSRAFARSEVLAAKRLWSYTAGADQLLHYLNSNLTPVGVPIDLDVVPDFSHFESVLVDYGPLVHTIFEYAHTLLEDAAKNQFNRDLLGANLASIEGIRGALVLEVQAKNAEDAVVATEMTQAQTRLQANRKALEANRAEQAQQRIEDAENAFWGTVAFVAEAVVAVAAAVYTGGASLEALVSAAGLLASADAALSWSYDKSTDTFVQGETSLANAFDWSSGTPQLKKELKDLVGGITDLVNKSKDFIDKAQAVSELFNAKVDGQLQSAEKELLIRQLDLTFDVNRLVLKRQQVALELAAIVQRQATADNDYQQIQKIQGTVQADIQSLAATAQALIRQAQGYNDIITKYNFYATRAYDLWTLGNRTSAFVFNFGYLDPDQVAGAFQAAARRDGSRVKELVKEYPKNWAKLPDAIKLRDDIVAYSTDLVTETRFFSFTDPGMLESLKKHGSVTFQIALPPGRFEAKLLNVGVALVGAQAGNDPSVSVIVEHTGQSTVQRRNGPPLTLHQPKRRDPVSATFDPTLAGDLQETEKQLFWGRSPSAIWRVELDSDSPVDLTNLQELQFGLYYKCFFK